MAGDYFVKDIALAEFGRKELDIAETEMPGLPLPTSHALSFHLLVAFYCLLLSTKSGFELATGRL